jgi:Tol biopolymer transport system component
MSSSYQLTDQVIARRLAERTVSPNPGLVADIMRATEGHPQRRPGLAESLPLAWQLLILVLLLAALAAIGIATAPPPAPPGLSVSIGRPMGGLQLSPDGRWGLPMAPGGQHAVVSTDPGAPRAADGSYEALITLKGDASGGAAWSADSRYVAWYGTSYPGVVTIYDLDHPDQPPTTISVAAALSGAAGFIGMLWSADGSQILFETTNCEPPCAAAGSATQLYLLDLPAGSVEVVSRTLPPGFAITWAPDGQSIGFVGGLIIDLQGRTIRDLLPVVPDAEPSVPRQCGSGPVWSPDGRRIAIIDPVSSDAGRLLIFDPGVSEARVLAADACAIIGWSPDGDRIVFLTGDSFATKWVQQGQGGGMQPTGPGSDAWIVPADGGEPQLIKHLGWGEVPILTWSDDGR